MFESYNMKKLGATLRTIRESNNLTRQQVSTHLGLHTDSLRKIESGSVIPKYESLEMLSQLYRIDILNLLRTHRHNISLENIYESLDEFLINDKIESILDLKNQIHKDPNKYALLSQDEYFTLKLFIDSVIVFHENKTPDLQEMVIILEQHIDINTLKNFKITQMASPLLTRLANVLAMIQMRLSNYDSSINILEVILEIAKTDATNLYASFKFVVKYCYSLSYCYFLQSNYEKSLYYANQGIDLAVKNQSMYMLYSLYSRKGASEFKLEIDTYKDSFAKCIHLADMLGDESLTKKYIEITREKYIQDFKI